MTLVYDVGRLWADVAAEVPVACYPDGLEPDPGRVAGVDLNGRRWWLDNQVNMTVRDWTRGRRPLGFNHG